MRSATVAAACLALVAFPSLVHGQAVVHPNQIRGTISFPNVHPEIRAEIDRASTRGGFAWRVVARSVGEPVMLESFLVETRATRTSLAYEMTVESSGSGIRYEVFSEIYDGWDHSPWGLVLESPGMATVLTEPAPDAVVDLSPCLSLLRISWVDGSGAPLPVGGGDVYVSGSGRNLGARARIEPGMTSIDILAPGDGASHGVTVTTTTGSDVTSDLVRTETNLSVVLGCDEVVTRVLGPGGALELGRVIGRYDVVGADEIAYDDPLGSGRDMTRIDLNNGPWLNQRIAVLSAPPNGDFELPNLVPSSATAAPRAWQLDTAALVLHDGREQSVTTTQRGVIVPAGDTLDLGDAYVMTPGILRVDERLVGPPPGDSPGGPVLEDAMDGRPGYGYRRPRVAGAQASPATTLEASLVLAGGFDPATGDVRSSLEILAAAPQGDVPRWNPTGLHLELADRATPAVPASYRDAWLTMTPTSAGAFPLAPGASIDSPLHVCFSQLDLDFYDIGGSFRSPLISSLSSGSLHGLDFEGNRQDRDVRFAALGTPRSIDPAAARGLVVTALPEGEYVLRPMVDSVDPSGSTTRTDLRPLHLTVGCRQVITGNPYIVVSVASLPPCTSSGPADIDVEADSALDVTSMTWSVNGSAPTTVCAPCGVGPSRTFVAPLAGGENEIVVRAVDARGHEAVTTSWVVAGTQPAGDPLLRVTKAASDRVTLEWGPSGTADVFVGSLAAVHAGRYDHGAVGACGLVAPTVDLEAGSAAYFLVGVSCVAGTGAVGHDSMGRPLPPPSPRCN